MSAAVLLTVDLRREADIVGARQRARQVAGLVGLDDQDRARVATAVSEIARNALLYAGGGRMQVEVRNDGPLPELVLRISDRGPGIADLDALLAGRYRSPTGMGLGLLGARRLMDDCRIETGPQGTTVTLVKRLPRGTLPPGEARRHAIVAELARLAPQDAFAELHQQNQELASSLAALRERHEELARLNRELEDTNRGVIALYAELDEKAESLRRADEAKSRFLSSASHELRTPLHSIRSLAQLLLDRADGPLTAEQERQVGFIRRAATELGELVDDLLDLAKIEAGRIEVRPAPFDLEGLWSTLRGMMRPLLSGGAVTLVFEPPPDVPLHGDEAKVAQVMRNFLSNALKFTERGEVRVAARPEGDWLRLSVADTGIGIDPARLPEIFEEFAQIDSPLQRRHKGTGLGLPLCRRLAGLLGGRIEADSRPGEGSVFSLLLPRPSATAVAADGARNAATAAVDTMGVDAADVPTRSVDQEGVDTIRVATAGPSGARPVTGAEASGETARPGSGVRSVLVVDDDEAMRYAITRALRPHLAVHEAADGESGLALVRSLRPDVLVLDLQMPGLDGRALIGRLDAATAPRLVVLTAQPVTAAEIAARAPGPVTLLRKGDGAIARLLALLSLPASPGASGDETP